MKTLAIVDNDNWTTDGLVMFMNSQMPELDIIWTSRTGEEALRHIDADDPDVMLVDMSLGEMSGTDLITRIRQHNRTIGIVAMTAFPLERYADPAAKAGAQALVSKRFPKHMLEVIKTVGHGGVGEPVGAIHFLPVTQAFAMVSKPLRGAKSLSATEREIVDLCSQGLTSGEIAQQMRKAIPTVNTHLQRAMEKTGARNRTQLVAMYLQSRIH